MLLKRMLSLFRPGSAADEGNAADPRSARPLAPSLADGIACIEAALAVEGADAAHDAAGRVADAWHEARQAAVCSATAPDVDDVDLPEPGHAWLALGRSLARAGHLGAGSAFAEAAGLLSAPGPAFLAHGQWLRTRHDLLGALDQLELAAHWAPDDALTLTELGEVQFSLGRVGEAEQLFDRATACLKDRQGLDVYVPTLPDASLHAEASCDEIRTFNSVDITQPRELLMRLCTGLGNVHARADRLQKALQMRRLAVTACPSRPELLAGVGEILLLLDQEEEAVGILGSAIDKVVNPPRFWLLLKGLAHMHLGNWTAARSLFANVYALEPGAAAPRWFMAQLELTLQNWATGWDLFVSRFASGAMKARDLPFPHWQGQAEPEKTVLILGDEGIGDEIMYANCLADAARQVGRCLVECEPRLARLFARSFPGVAVVGSLREDWRAALKRHPQPDLQVSSGDLPRYFRRSDAAFLPRRAYLKADPEAVNAWRRRLLEEHGSGLRVGISWRGGSARTRTRARSVPLDTFAGLLSALPAASFISLQYGDAAEDCEALSSMSDKRVADYPEVHADYDDTAALVAALDVVVTVCTSVVHLAGALGQRVHVLAPMVPGWRYGADTPEMPWYRDVHIHRCTHADDWTRPCALVVRAVESLTGNVTSTSP